MSKVGKYHKAGLTSTQKLLPNGSNYLQSSLSMMNSFRSFSEYFRHNDIAEMEKYDIDIQLPKHFVRYRDSWQLPLEKKKAKRVRKAERWQKLAEEGLEVEKDEEGKVISAPRQLKEDEKFIVHNIGYPLNLPTPPNQIFAIVNIGGRQHKVTQDDVVVTEIQRGIDVNEQVVFDQVYQVGTRDYTLLGRPVVTDAKIYATVEQITQGEKTLVFKKRRRKGYKRTHGFRAELITFRIDKIDFTLNEERHFQKAVGN